MSFLHYENHPVDLSKPGAKEARVIIKQYHTYLNSSDVLPEQWARPSAGHFFLVSYVNTIIGLFISKNYEVIPLFIMRAFRFLQEVPESPVSEHYCILVRQYLYQMAYFLQTYTATSQDNIQAFIPQEVLNAGSQPPPPTTLVKQVRPPAKQLKYVPCAQFRQSNEQLPFDQSNSQLLRMAKFGE